MARREVIEVICDRCSRTETQEPSEAGKAYETELTVTFEGETVEYKDLCMRCRKACDGYFKSLTKQSDKDEPDTAPVPESKPGMFGLGGKK